MLLWHRKRDTKIHTKPAGGGGREVPEGGDIRILMADSRCCMAETNTTL